MSEVTLATANNHIFFVTVTSATESCSGWWLRLLDLRVKEKSLGLSEAAVCTVEKVQFQNE